MSPSEETSAGDTAVTVAHAPFNGPETIAVHPLVLLSVVDHYERVAKNSNRRVLGILLGSWQDGTLDVSNSFAVPFEEDEKDLSVFYLDHRYIQKVYSMFKKVNAREQIVGWYHTGPKLRSNDLVIHAAISAFVQVHQQHACLVVIDVSPHSQIGQPTDAYVAVEEIHDDGTPPTRTFEHVASEIVAEEAEEVGVEHLLRDVKAATTGTLSEQIVEQVNALKGLLSRLQECYDYLESVEKGELPMNHSIVYQLQDMFNLLPDVSAPEMVKAFSRTTNDQLLVIYTSSLIRAVVSLHSLIDNKLQNNALERKSEEDAEKKQDKDKKEEEEKKKKDEEAEEKKPE